MFQIIAYKRVKLYLYILPTLFYNLFILQRDILTGPFLILLCGLRTETIYLLDIKRHCNVVTPNPLPTPPPTFSLLYDISGKNLIGYGSLIGDIIGSFTWLLSSSLAWYFLFILKRCKHDGLLLHFLSHVTRFMSTGRSDVISWILL